MAAQFGALLWGRPSHPKMSAHRIRRAPLGIAPEEGGLIGGAGEPGARGVEPGLRLGCGRELGASGLGLKAESCGWGGAVSSQWGVHHMLTHPAGAFAAKLAAAPGPATLHVPGAPAALTRQSVSMSGGTGVNGRPRPSCSRRWWRRWSLGMGKLGRGRRGAARRRRELPCPGIGRGERCVQTAGFLKPGARTGGPRGWATAGSPGDRCGGRRPRLGAPPAPRPWWPRRAQAERSGATLAAVARNARDATRARSSASKTLFATFLAPSLAVRAEGHRVVWRQIACLAHYKTQKDPKAYMGAL
jgi:hypothetical protein